MLLVEVSVPQYLHKRITNLWQVYRDTIREVTKSKASGLIRIFIENSPKGWWLALRIFRQGSTSRLYILKEIKYIDVPSKVMELSMKRRWKPEYEKIIEEELRKWGLRP